MFPRAILFDLDDTLFDHQRASMLALTAMHAEFGAGIEFTPFANRHHDVLEEFHRHFLAGKYTLDEARMARMKVLFGAFGRNLDDETALAAAALYREQHQANRALVAGARELLDALHGEAPHGEVLLGIITNNSTVEQHEKLRALDIARYFDTIIISEDAGFAKPDPRIFALALHRVGVEPAQALMVGDNWQNDIEGAMDAGMAAIWLNRNLPIQSQAPARLAANKWLKSRTQAGVSSFFPLEITQFTPLASTLAAIKKAFIKRTPGVTEHEQLETLAS